MLMFSTCIFCQKSLGSNEALEEFPVGRRLAYDPAKGRLWVVCRKCERWNLSPLEIRWEAIEACERFYHDTRLRVSTDNIGLAKLSEGLELVRIGEPQRPEFAAWRYGDQFGRRRKRFMLYGALGVAGLGLVVVGGAAAGLSIGGGWYGYDMLVRAAMNERVAVRLKDTEGNQIRVQHKHLQKSRLVPVDGSDEWELHLQHAAGWRSGPSRQSSSLILTGDEAVDVAGRLMARVNASGGSQKNVQLAVGRIEEIGDPEAFILEASRESRRLQFQKAQQKRKDVRTVKAGALKLLPVDIRLALEMATQEQSEREAMEGELAKLEAAWQAAEEIANIADNLLVSTEAEQFIDEEKERLQEEGALEPAD